MTAARSGNLNLNFTLIDPRPAISLFIAHVIQELLLTFTFLILNVQLRSSAVFIQIYDDMIWWLDSRLSALKTNPGQQNITAFCYFICMSYILFSSQTRELKLHSKLLCHILKYITEFKCHSIYYTNEAFRVHSYSGVCADCTYELATCHAHWFLNTPSDNNVRTSNTMSQTAFIKHKQPVCNAGWTTSERLIKQQLVHSQNVIQKQYL